MLKRFFCVVMCLCFFPAAAYAAQEEPQISARCAALIVADSGELIYGKNEHERRGMASTTKIMTALLTAEYAMPQRVVVTTPAMVNVEGTSMGLAVGDRVTFHDLIYGMLLASGNDAANTAAIAISGSLGTFAQLMNARAKEIGMHDTNFVTPSGLDNEKHYSTAYDMAMLGRCAMKNSAFAQACGSTSAKLCYGNEPYARYLSNHNRLLRCYNGAVGIKTGFTKKSGRCLVSAAMRDGVMLICVTLCAPDDWDDHRKLLDYGFKTVSVKTQKADLSKTSLKVFGGVKSFSAVEQANPVSIATLCGADKIKTQVVLRPFEFAPIKKGQIVGEIRYLLGEKIVASSAIITSENISATTVEKPERAKRKPIKQRIKELLRRFFSRSISLNNER